MLKISTFFARTTQLNLRALNLTTLSYIENRSTCLMRRSIKILKNKELRYLIFEKYLF